MVKRVWLCSEKKNKKQNTNKPGVLLFIHCDRYSVNQVFYDIFFLNFTKCSSIPICSTIQDTRVCKPNSGSTSNSLIQSSGCPHTSVSPSHRPQNCLFKSLSRLTTQKPKSSNTSSFNTFGMLFSWFHLMLMPWLNKFPIACFTKIFTNENISFKKNPFKM